MAKLKIGLVLDDSLDRGDGVQQYVRTLGNWLTEGGHDVNYLVGQSDGAETNVHSLARNIDVSFNGNRLSVPLPGNRSQITKLIEAEQFDVLHVQMPYSPFMAAKVIKAAPAETAVVGTFHILPRGRLQKLTSRGLATVLHRTLPRFDGVCSVSKPAAEFAKQNFGINSEVIPCMIDLKEWKRDEKVHPRRIVFLGRLVERKGCRQLLESLAQVPQTDRNSLEVIVAGDGPERSRLEAYANENNLTVRFIGFVPEGQKAALLASAELAVFPALGGESFGIVLIEAMAAGAGVVIGGNNPGYASVLGEWPDVLVEPMDSREFAERLLDLLHNKQRATELHEEQQKSVAKYDVNTVGAQILDLYKAALLHRRQEMR